MAKKTPFFSHDMNARHDPKMTAMRGVYGVQGYGIFWILVEMMGEADGYRLDMKGKYAFDSYAVQANCERNTVVSFVNDCINEFELFQSDGVCFWSPSLLRRMEYRDQKSEKARESVSKRWNGNERNTNVQRPNNDGNTINKTKQNIKHNVDFDEFWSIYPKKQGKTIALKKWEKLHKDGMVDMDEVVNGTTAYIAFIEKERKRGFERQYLDGSTFVSQQRWKDDWGTTDKKVVNFKQEPEDLRNFPPLGDPA